MDTGHCTLRKGKKTNEEPKWCPKDTFLSYLQSWNAHKGTRKSTINNLAQTWGVVNGRNILIVISTIKLSITYQWRDGKKMAHAIFRDDRYFGNHYHRAVWPLWVGPCLFSQDIQWINARKYKINTRKYKINSHRKSVGTNRYVQRLTPAKPHPIIISACSMQHDMPVTVAKQFAATWWRLFNSANAWYNSVPCLSLLSWCWNRVRTVPATGCRVPGTGCTAHVDWTP